MGLFCLPTAPDCSSEAFDLLATSHTNLSACDSPISEALDVLAIVLARVAPVMSAVVLLVSLVSAIGLDGGGSCAVQPPAKGSPEVLTVGAPPFVWLLLFVSVVSAFTLKPWSLSCEVSLSWRK